MLNGYKIIFALTIALPFVKYMVISVYDFTENCVNLAELSFSFTRDIQPR